MILWVLVIQISRRCRHWAVDIYRNIRNPAFGHQSMEVIQEQLRSPDSKRRDKDHTAVFECLINNALKIGRSEEHTSELQSRENLVCRLLLEKKSKTITRED